MCTVGRLHRDRWGEKGDGPNALKRHRTQGDTQPRFATLLWEVSGVNRDRPRAISAFRTLLGELRDLKKELGDAGQEAFASGDHVEAANLAGKLRQASDLEAMLQKAREHWSKLTQSTQPIGRRCTLQRRSRFKRLQGGLKTPETAYRTPILETLIELGGRASTDDIRDRLLRKLDGVLGDYDLEGLPSNPTCPRWWNTAMWCRLYMVREGLLKSSSPRGIWEITNRGRQSLERERAAQPGTTSPT